MLQPYIEAAISKAEYKQLEDGTYYGEVPQLSGAWGKGNTREECEKALHEMVEFWLNKTFKTHE